MSPASLARRMLVPLIPVYRLGLGFRELRLRRGWEPVHRLRFPVISIGNLSTGGTGKTPFVIALAKALTARGWDVDVLSRGFGRMNTAAARVHPDGSASDFGDEPLLIARDAAVPVYVAAQRHQAGLLAESDDLRPSMLSAPLPHTGPDSPGQVHLLDDGFQHRQLHRDVDILLLNRTDWDDRLLPAGNLREPLRALRRADVVAIPDTDPDLGRDLRHQAWTGPVWRLHRHLDAPPVSGPVLAFCGIARPDQFFSSLQSAGLSLTRQIAFRDHHAYTDQDLDRLFAAARSAGAVAVVTTAKDQVRLAPLATFNSSEIPLLTAGLRLEICEQDSALDWLEHRLREASGRLSL